MKVLNLQCEHQHTFEGWFGSEDDFQQQRDRGLLACPVCGATHVLKMPSAPRLNLGAPREEGLRLPAEAPKVPQAPAPELQARLLKAMREIVAQTEDVGERFADQARAMHQGDIAQRNIRGRASPEVAMALIEEGIDVVPLPDLPVIKETLQ